MMISAKMDWLAMRHNMSAGIVEASLFLVCAAIGVHGVCAVCKVDFVGVLGTEVAWGACIVGVATMAGVEGDWREGMGVMGSIAGMGAGGSSIKLNVSEKQRKQL
jgi:hypothetical protein